MVGLLCDGFLQLTFFPTVLSIDLRRLEVGGAMSVVHVTSDVYTELCCLVLQLSDLSSATVAIQQAADGTYPQSPPPFPLSIPPLSHPPFLPTFLLFLFLLFSIFLILSSSSSSSSSSVQVSAPCTLTTSLSPQMVSWILLLVPAPPPCKPSHPCNGTPKESSLLTFWLMQELSPEPAW